MKIAIILACLICLAIFILAIGAVYFIAKRIEAFAELFNTELESDEPELN